MATLGKAYVNILANLNPLKKGLRLAFNVTKRSMAKISRAVKRGALLIVAAMTGAVIAAAKFQKQMSMVSTMLDEKTMPLMEKFANSVETLAVKYGQGTATLSKGLYDVLSASIDASKAISVLEVSSRAAVAGMTETGVAADALTTIINSYAMKAEDAEMISDKLFATVKRGKTTFPELASSIGRVASTASIAGMSLDELLAAIATATRAGINSTEAMTSLNGVLRAFLNPTDDAKKAAKKFGLELSSNTLKTIGFLGAVKKLNGATPEMLGKIIPNIRAFKGLAAALKNVEGLTLDLSLISEQSAGKMDEAYRKMAEDAGFRFDQTKEAVLKASRAFGDDLLPEVTYVMGKITQFLENNNETLRRWGGVVADQLGRFVDWLDIVANDIETLGWGKAMELAMLDVSDAVSNSWDKIKNTMLPKVKEVGAILGTAFAEAFGESIKKGLAALPRSVIEKLTDVTGAGILKTFSGNGGILERAEQKGESAVERGREILNRRKAWSDSMQLQNIMNRDFYPAINTPAIDNKETGDKKGLSDTERGTNLLYGVPERFSKTVQESTSFNKNGIDRIVAAIGNDRTIYAPVKPTQQRDGFALNRVTSANTIGEV